MRVAFAGTPEFALPSLEALRTHHEVVGVLTQPDRPSGRGRALEPSPIKRSATALGLPLAQPATLRGEPARAQLFAWRPEVLVVVAYGLLLPGELLALPRLGCVNVHASLLPRWRGAAPIQRALLAGDALTGVSIMQMDEGLDSGPLLLQRRIAIGADDTGGTLGHKLASLGAAALLEALTGLADGTLRATPQPGEGITYAAKVQKAEARIDWTQEAAAIERQVRAFNPRPIAETRLRGEQLRIFAARAIEAQPDEDIGVNLAETASNCSVAGTIVGLRDDSLLVRCGRGCLAVSEVQRPGRRPVGARELSHSLALTGERLG